MSWSNDYVKEQRAEIARLNAGIETMQIFNDQLIADNANLKISCQLSEEQVVALNEVCLSHANFDLQAKRIEQQGEEIDAAEVRKVKLIIKIAKLNVEFSDLKEDYDLQCQCRDEYRQERDRLANDALNELSGIVCTPAEGYVKAPHCLKGDIAKAIRQVKEKGRLEGIESVNKLPHRAMFDDGFTAGQVAEREECAKEAEGCTTMTPTPLDEQWDDACAQIAKTIRARK